MPVEASVAAILAPICPLLPTPVTMTRPRIAETSSIARAKASERPLFRASASAATPACSVATVLSADAIAALRSGSFFIGTACMDDAISASRPGCPTLSPVRQQSEAAFQPSINHPHLRFGKHGAARAFNHSGRDAAGTPRQKNTSRPGRVAGTCSWQPRLPGWPFPAPSQAQESAGLRGALARATPTRRCFSTRMSRRPSRLPPMSP